MRDLSRVTTRRTGHRPIRFRHIIAQAAATRSWQHARITRRNARFAMVGTTKWQRARRARYVAKAKRSCVYRRFHVGMGSSIEWDGASGRILRRKPRRRTHQRARGTGRVVRPQSFRSARAGADGSDCHRFQSDRIRCSQHDIAVAEDPRALPRAAQLVPDGGRYPMKASHLFDPEQLGRPAVPPKRQSRVGATYGSYPSHRTQNRAFLVALQRPRTPWFYPILPRTRRSASPRASARLVLVPSAKARRRNDFS